MRRAALALACALGGGVFAAGQPPPARPAASPAPPVFSSASDLVLVDATVTDSRDAPVTDLTALDFRVTEDGVEMPVVSFAAFGRVRPTVAEGAGSGPAVVARDVPSATALFVDEGHLSPAEAATAKDSLRGVVRALAERGGSILLLAPFVNVAFGGRLPEDSDLVHEGLRRIRGRRFPAAGRFPMTDAEALAIEAGDASTLDRLTARFQYLNPGYGTQASNDVRSRATELAVAAHARRRDAFAAMRVAFAWLSKQPGRRTFLLVSSGFPSDARDPEFGTILNESFRVHAPIHFVDASSVAPMGRFEGIDQRYALPQDMRVAAWDSTESLLGSRLLALDTGGRHVGLSELDRGLRAIIDATRTYYVLGYERTANPRAGFRRIEVEVRRAGVRVRARKGYFDQGRTAPEVGR